MPSPTIWFARRAEALRRTVAVGRSRLDYLYFVYGASVRWFGALVISGVLLVGPLLPRPFDLIVTWVGIGFAVVALIELVVTGIRAYLRWTAVDLVPRSEPFPWAGAQWTDAGRIVPISAATVPERAWQSPEVDALLRAAPALTSGIHGSVESHRFRLTHALAGIGGRSLRHRSARRGDGASRKLPPARFNGHLVRLATEPTPRTLGSGELVFQHVRYYDGESSNEVWPLVVAGGGHPLRSPVEPYVVDRRNRMLSLEQARTANILGISVFALTADDQLILVRQSMRNSVSPGSFASSSSGSADPEDFGAKPGHGVRDSPALAGVMTGMLRELTEESRVRRDEVVDESAIVTGYYRWLDRGAKPEFTGLVRVTARSSDLAARLFRGGESAFTVDLAFLPASFARTEAHTWRNDTAEPAERAAAAIARFVARVDELSPGTGVGASCVAAWLAAVDYLAGNEDWLGPKPEPVT